MSIGKIPKWGFFLKFFQKIRKTLEFLGWKNLRIFQIFLEFAVLM